MQLPTISLQQIILFFIFIAALSHFILPLIPRSCGDHTAPCDVNKKHAQSLKFCRNQNFYWKWKMKFLTPSGDHAGILLTMINVGNKNFADFKRVIAMQSRCATCSEKKVGNAELDRATRAYRSARNIARKCTFHFM